MCVCLMQLVVYKVSEEEDYHEEAIGSCDIALKRIDILTPKVHVGAWRGASPL